MLSTAIISGFLALVAPATPPPLLPQQAQSAEPSQLTIEDEVDGAKVLAIALAGSAAIGLVMSAVVEHQHPKQASQRGSFSSNSRHHGATFDQVSHSLRNKLLRLLHEDYGAASRLFAHTSVKYPGKAPNWYVEKIIYDLERDRGGR